jgi:hypothetical protein
MGFIETPCLVRPSLLRPWVPDDGYRVRDLSRRPTGWSPESNDQEGLKVGGLVRNAKGQLFSLCWVIKNSKSLRAREDAESVSR